MEGGVLEIEGTNAVWMDPVAVLNRAYSGYEVSYGGYYSRSSFGNSSLSAAGTEGETRKRKRKKIYIPNKKEVLAELRHQESRSAILNAHSLFLATRSFTTSEFRNNRKSSELPEQATLANSVTAGVKDNEVDFVRLAEVWQAPLYELNLLRKPSIQASDDADENKEMGPRTIQLFGTVFHNDDEEALAECAGNTFILPGKCRFLMSDISHIHHLIPSNPTDGYNLILVDPPWENKSVHRKSLYPTLPNRQLLSLPIQQLVHSDGALLALWLTNREKLHQFVEKELFPAWGVEFVADWYWLKLNDSGGMISPLDLQHHKPYECLLLGYISRGKKEVSPHESPQQTVIDQEGSVRTNLPPNKFVLMSIPGDHSRKPPVGSLLARYAPGRHPVTGLELFARELTPGWTSWGNEPLRFQNMKYFQQKSEVLSLAKSSCDAQQLEEHEDRHLCVHSADVDTTYDRSTIRSLL